MFVTIINDCKDPNAFGRQSTKAAALLGAPVNLVGVNSDLEAAGNLIDVLTAGEGAKGVVLVNVAPRNGAAKKWPNGTPFGWFTYGNTIVVASIDGLTLSLVKKFSLTKEINVFDIPTVMDAVAAQGLIDKETSEYVKSTQFRSLEFIPRAAAWLVKGWKLPSKTLSINEIADAPAAVWWVDNFGNCKTTLLPEELSEFIDNDSLSGLASLELHDRLKDVPNSDAAFVIGSSGMPGRRLVEVMVQGDSAAKRFGLTSGSSLRAEPMTAHEEALVAVMR